jgi:hypothetical protein
MKPFFRLYGKKRGHRLAGWWLAGRVGEAFWFATLFSVGVLTLSVVLGLQLFSPDTNAYRIGHGFWLLVLISSLFIGIGSVGFIYRVLSVAYSAEYRSAIANRGLIRKAERRTKGKAPPSAIPSLQAFTDSPGVRLSFRLPENRPETRQLVLASLFVLAWDALAVLITGFALGGLLRGKADWFLSLVAVPFFLYVGFRVSRWFFLEFRRATGIGPTTIEIDELPLIGGNEYHLSLVQYGKLAMKKLSITLVCEEVATYHFGTDTRTERHEVYRQSVLEQGRCRIDWGRPLELTCNFMLPKQLMHSFQSPHNSITWKFTVEGEASRWPLYCRSFPVVVYPAVSKASQPVEHLNRTAPPS